MIVEREIVSRLQQCGSRSEKPVGKFQWRRGCREWEVFRQVNCRVDGCQAQGQAAELLGNILFCRGNTVERETAKLAQVNLRYKIKQVRVGTARTNTTVHHKP